MKHLKEICCALGLGLVTMGGVAAADEAPAASDSMVMKMSASATVMKVDTAKRDLMLKDAQGVRMFKVHVPEDVSRFDAIKKGDHIKLDYYQSIGLSLKKPAAGAEPGASDTTVGDAVPGALPNGVVARKITESVMVMNIDSTHGMVLVKGPDGDLNIINVSDPAVKAELAKLKKGDRIQATYTEAVAIAVTPADEKKPPADEKKM